MFGAGDVRWVGWVRYGADHDATLLNEISEAGGGEFAYVEHPRNIRQSFARCLAGFMSMCVQVGGRAPSLRFPPAGQHYLSPS